MLWPKCCTVNNLLTAVQLFFIISTVSVHLTFFSFFIHTSLKCTLKTLDTSTSLPTSAFGKGNIPKTPVWAILADKVATDPQIKNLPEIVDHAGTFVILVSSYYTFTTHLKHIYSNLGYYLVQTLFITAILEAHLMIDWTRR